MTPSLSIRRACRCSSEAKQELPAYHSPYHRAFILPFQNPFRCLLSCCLCVVPFCVKKRESKSKNKKQESKSKNPKQQRTHLTLRKLSWRKHSQSLVGCARSSLARCRPLFVPNFDWQVAVGTLRRWLELDSLAFVASSRRYSSFPASQPLTSIPLPNRRSIAPPHCFPSIPMRR